MWVVFGICFSEDRGKNILNYAKIVSGTDFWGWTEFRVLFFPNGDFLCYTNINIKGHETF